LNEETWTKRGALRPISPSCQRYLANSLLVLRTQVEGNSMPLLCVISTKCPQPRKSSEPKSLPSCRVRARDKGSVNTGWYGYLSSALLVLLSCSHFSTCTILARL